ncbi:MAG: NusG domain II-containing protein [Clostridia bacterium]|nr:NusG domain II-containing protein [Clostridia bacterium]
MSKERNWGSPVSGSAKKIKNDIALIVALLALVLLATLALLLLRTEGDRVVVTLDGQLWGEFSLQEDRTVEIRNGDGYNRLVIKDGKAYVQEANCPDGICSAHRPIGYGGESIICLPNKVVVEIRSQNQGQPDIIS